MFFLPQDTEKRHHCQYIFEQAVIREGQSFLGWRKLPLEDTCLGVTATSSMPYIMQAFVGCSSELTTELAVERKLYVIR